MTAICEVSGTDLAPGWLAFVGSNISRSDADEPM